MKVETREVYTTKDGKSFFDLDSAKRHEDRLSDSKSYHIHYAPNLTDTGSCTKDGFIICNTKWAHDLLVEDWLYREFGGRVAFVQGVSPTLNWSYREISMDEVDQNKVIARIKK